MHRSVLVVLILSLLLVGCRAGASPKPSQTQPVSQPSAQAFVTPNAVDSVATPGVISEDEWSLDVISEHNVQQLELLGRYGEGRIDQHIAVSPDGKWLAVAAQGGVLLYDAASGTRQWLLQTDSAVDELAFSPDSTKLAFSNGLLSDEYYQDPEFLSPIPKPVLSMVSTPGGDLIYLKSLAGSGCGEYRTRDLQFSADGQKLIFSDGLSFMDMPRKGALCILRAEDAALEKVIPLNDQWLANRLIQLGTTDGSLLVIAVDNSESRATHTERKELRRYNLQNGTYELIDMPLSQFVHSELESSPDLLKHALWLEDGISIYERDGSGPVINLPVSNQLMAVFRLGSDKLATGYLDGSTDVYDLADGKRLAHIDPVLPLLSQSESALRVVDLTFSPDGAILYRLLNSFFVDIPVFVQAVRLSDGKELWRFSGRNTIQRTPFLSPDGTLIALSAYEDGHVELWDSTQQQIASRLEGNGSQVLQTAFLPDGQLLAGITQDGDVMIWQVRDGSQVNQWAAHQGMGWAIATSQDGSMLVTAGSDGMLKLWRAADGVLVDEIESGAGEQQVNSVAFTPDTRAVRVQFGCAYPELCKDPRGEYLEIDLGSRTSTVLLSNSWMTSVQVSADGRAYGAFDGRSLSGQIENGEFLPPADYFSPFGNGRTYGAAVNADGSLFFAGNNAGIQVWQSSDQAFLHVLPWTEFGDLTFSDDGKLLIVNGSNGVVYLYGVRLDR